MKNKKVIIVIVLILLVIGIAIGYSVYQKKKRKALMEGATEGGSTKVPGTGTGGTPVQYSDEFPLKIGSKGNNVTALQYAINEGCPEVGSKIAVDGVFGPQTEAASNLCLADQNGHVNGQVSYSEYKYLTKRISTTQELQIKNGCQASAASRAMMLTVYGVNCDDMGY